MPDYVSFYSATEGRDFAPGTAGFLGSRYAPMELTTSLMPENIRRPEAISELDHRQRGRAARPAEPAVRAGPGLVGPGQPQRGLPARPRPDGQRDALRHLAGAAGGPRRSTGPTQFGEQALVARRLVEAGVPFVRVGRAWWDSHGQNFETHQELVPELDHVMSTLLDDLRAAAGCSSSTLVITLAEFGRTPTINPSLGRDHFASAWSATLSGCGIQGGSVYGKTDATGQAVVDGEVGAAELFATIYQALGHQPSEELLRRLAARPADRARHRADRRRAGLITSNRAS